MSMANLNPMFDIPENNEFKKTKKSHKKDENEKVEKTVVIEPTKIYISGSIKKSTGNYGTVDIQFGITKPVEGEDLREQADDIFKNVILNAVSSYISQLYSVSKKLDKVIDVLNSDGTVEDSIYKDVEY
jgi:hypothetical protein